MSPEYIDRYIYIYLTRCIFTVDILLPTEIDEIAKSENLSRTHPERPPSARRHLQKRD